MKIQKAHLNQRICDISNEPDDKAINTETFREFIQNTEKEFGLDPVIIDDLSEWKLNEYLEFLDDLWLK